MSGYNYLKGSDGSGNAVLAHVTLARLVAATVLKVDSVSKWPVGGFIATVGTLDGTGFLIPASITEFTGHITGSDIIIDGFEAGFTDLGNSIGQVVVIKQTTGWANSVTANAQVGHNDDGTHKSTALDAFYRPSEITPDNFIYSGGIVAISAGLISTMSDIVAYISGLRFAKTGIANRTWNANKDGYVDIDNTGTVTYTEVANGAASPALVAGRIRVAIVITGASITSIQQIGSFDSLGNKVYPRGSVSTSNAPDLWWQEAGRFTFGAAAVSGTFFIKPYKYLEFIISINCTGNNGVALRFNGDSGNNYSDSYSLQDGNANGTDVSQNFAPLFGLGTANTNKISSRGFMENPAASAKPGRFFSMKVIGAATTAPVPEELWLQWTNIASAINQVTLFDRGGINMGIGTEIVVLGHN